MALSLTLFLLLVLLVLPLCFFGCYSYSLSSTVLVLVLPTSIPFIFSKIKHLLKFSSMDKVGLVSSPEDEDNKENATNQEDIKFQYSESVLAQGECSPLENDILTMERSTANEESENACCDTSSSSEDCSTTDDETLTEIVGSACSTLDDENLIEITLKEPNNLFPQPSTEACLAEPDFLPESQFKKHGMMDLLSEVNEDDNLIEIDITVGSIKCSRLEIKA